MQMFDELALTVALKEPRLEVELAGPVLDPVLQFGQRKPAIDLRIAPLEHIEVDAVHHLDPVARAQPISSTIASRTLSGSTRSPSRGSPGADRSTKRTPSASRFLSRPRASRIASGSTSPSIW